MAGKPIPGPRVAIAVLALIVLMLVIAFTGWFRTREALKNSQRPPASGGIIK